MFDLLSFASRRARWPPAGRFGRGVRAESRATSDPTLRTVYLSDAVSIGADVVTLVALALTQLTGSSVPQGVASVLIGLALIGSRPPAHQA